MNDVTVIDRFLATFSRYIDSGFGLLQGEVAFLTATLIVIDMTIAGLYWAMSHATDQGDDVIAKLLRKVLYVGAFAYIINNLPYAIPLEFGHSTQAPGGMVRVTVARFQQIVQEAIRNNQV